MGSLASFPVAGNGEVPSRYRYQKLDGPDRYEGVRSGSQAEGEVLELLSVTAQAHLTHVPDPKKISLGFVATVPADVSITVRDAGKNYWMEPIDVNGKKLFKAKSGFNFFSWDAQDVRYIRRQPEELCALVEVPSRSGTVIYPSLMWDPESTPSTEIQIKEYQFVFLPNTKVDFSYEIRSTDKSILGSDDMKNLPKGKLVSIPWTAGTRPDGTYHFSGKVTFYSDRGTSSSQPIDLDFVHTAVLHVKN
jgi:hypothetical protein